MEVMARASAKRRRGQRRRWERSGAAPTASRRIRLRLLGLAMVLLSVASSSFLVLGSTAARAGAQPDDNADPYFTLTVNASTSDLVDGQALPFTVTRTAAGQTAGLQIAAVGTGWCQPTVNLAIDDPPAPMWSETPFGKGGYNSSLTGFPIVSSGGVGTLPCLATLGKITTPLPPITPPHNLSGDYPTVSGNAFVEEAEQSIPPNSGPLSGISVSCDADHSCLFAVAIWTVDSMGNDDIYFAGVPVSFEPAVDQACNGADANELAIESPDRLGQAVTSWLIDACHLGYDGGKAMGANISSSVSDQQALCDYASGAADMVFSGIGYGAANSDFNPSGSGPAAEGGTNCLQGAQTDRSYLAVPVALNAVVLAHDQNQSYTPAYSSFGVPIEAYSQQLDISLDDFAQLLANGGTVGPGGVKTAGSADNGDWNSNLGTSLSTLNPELLNGTQSTCATCAITSATVATSGSDASTWYATSFLSDLAATTLWSQPGNAGSTAIPSQQLGPISNFGTEDDPPYDVVPATGATGFAHQLTPTSGSYWWGLTNSLTSASTWGGLANFALQAPDTLGGTPTYVVPDTQTMQLAASEMVAQPDGTFVPDPSPTAVSGVEPYPLTYIEYALVPNQPLLNADCSVNAGAEKDLENFVGYLITDGQQQLPPGLVPLTPSLQALALSRFLQIGTGVPSCTPTSTTTTTSPTTTTTTTTASTSGSGGSSGSSSGSSTGTGTTDVASSYSSSSYASSSLGTYSTSDGSIGTTSSGASAPGPAATASQPAKGATGSQRPHIPTELAVFRQVSPAGWLGPVLGVIVLAILLPGLVLLASGRSPAELAARLRGRPPTGAQGPEGGSPA